MSRYVLKVSSARVPSSCEGRYNRIGIMKMVAEGLTPKMISARAKGVERVIRTWEKLYVGSTEKCAYRRALKEAKTLLDELTAAELNT